MGSKSNSKKKNNSDNKDTNKVTTNNQIAETHIFASELCKYLIEQTKITKLENLQNVNGNYNISSIGDLIGFIVNMRANANLFDINSKNLKNAIQLTFPESKNDKNCSYIFQENLYVQFGTEKVTYPSNPKKSYNIANVMEVILKAYDGRLDRGECIARVISESLRNPEILANIMLTIYEHKYEAQLIYNDKNSPNVQAPGGINKDNLSPPYTNSNDMEKNSDHILGLHLINLDIKEESGKWVFGRKNTWVEDDVGKEVFPIIIGKFFDICSDA